MKVCKLFVSKNTILQYENESIRTDDGTKDCFRSAFLCSIKPYDEEDANSVALFHNLKSKLHDTSQKFWKFHLLIERISNAKDMMRVKLWGSLLHELTALCGFTANVSLMLLRNDDPKEAAQFLDMPIYTREAEGDNALLGCCYKEIKGPDSFPHWNDNRNIFVSLILECQVDVNMHNQNMKTLQKAINSANCDVCIVGAGDVSIKCHKSIIAEHSDVLAKSLEIGSVEYPMTQIRLSNLSEVGLKGLLEYFYTKNLSIVKSTFSSDVALQLYEVAIKYKIQTLEHILDEYLSDIPPYYYAIGAANSMLNCKKFRKYCSYDSEGSERLPNSLRDDATN